MGQAQGKGGRRRQDRARQNQHLVGVIGGLGPKATAVWYDDNVLRARVELFRAMSRVAADGPAAMLESVKNVSSAAWTAEELARVWEARVGQDKVRDQDHISLLIYSNPTIAGRPEFMSGQSQDDPTAAMHDTAQALVDGGATALCMVCSTAHYFKPGMLAGIDVPFLDMLDLSLDFIARSVTPNEDGSIVVGLLGTEPLLRFQVYEKACEARFPDGKIKMLTPLATDGGDQDNFTEAIFGTYGIKAGYDSDLACSHTRRNFDLLMEEVHKLQAAGAKAIILGCTELPLLISEDSIRETGAGDEHGVPLLVNPAQVLADEVIRYSLACR